jgi:hypothetical protein
MNFNATLSYLGAQQNKLKDGTIFYKVSFFDINAGAPVQINIMSDRGEILQLLSGCKFGEMLSCNFSLLPKDNLYRLVLVTCEKAGK